MKLMWMMLFMVLPLLALVYLSWHVWTILPVASVWKVLVIALGVGSFLLLFLNFGRRFDTWPLPVAQAFYEIGTSSIFILMYLVILFLVLDLGRLVHLVPRSWLYQNGWTAAAIFVLIFGIFLYGNLHYKNKVRVALDLQTDKPLPRDYKIVMMSDLHIGYHNTRKELARWVDLVNAEQPDFILIAGDIIDGSMRPLLEERMAEEFHRLSAPVYACLGNHEYYSGCPEAQQFYRDAGIRLLIDSTAVVDSALVIIGRDDRTNRRRKPIADLKAQAPPSAPEGATNVKAPPSAPEGATNVLQQGNEAPSGAVGGASAFTIVLDHQPYNLDRTEAAGVDFQLSGHTHRGQVWPISWITDHVYECSWGPYQRGRTRYYVSSGIGIWGGKFRIGTQSEYVVARLYSSSK